MEVLSWLQFLLPIVGAGTRGVIVRWPTMFRQSLVASTADRRTQSPRRQDRCRLRISAPAVVRPDALGALLRPNTRSVGVRRDMIFRSTLVTATARTGKPCISLALNTTAVVCRLQGAAIQGGQVLIAKRRDLQLLTPSPDGALSEGEYICGAGSRIGWPCCSPPPMSWRGRGR
jgi:hypothetical protein